MSRIKFVFISILLVTSIGCDDNLKEVRKISVSEFSPTGDADDFNIKYTDSGRITAILESPKMLDYSTVIYPFTEFPKGILVTLFDKNKKKTFIKSDYAVSYKSSNIIDLRKNVKISNEQGQYMITEQLYFDQKNEWFYTEQPFTMVDPKAGTTSGQGIDFNKDFTIINYQNVTGNINK